jgi:hypothetical protein
MKEFKVIAVPFKDSPADRENRGRAEKKVFAMNPQHSIRLAVVDMDICRANYTFSVLDVEMDKKARGL